jgi:hypothetical protein
VNLKFTFKRTVNNKAMNFWYELLQVANGIHFTGEEDDVIVWQFNSTRRYFVQSLYAVINDRGVSQIFTPVMWKIHVPPKIHIFLWLLANTKTLTRDNLAQRRKFEDMTCLFYT